MRAPHMFAGRDLATTYTTCRRCRASKNRHHYDNPGDRVCSTCRVLCSICGNPRTGADAYRCKKCLATYARNRHQTSNRRTGHSVDFYTLWAWLDTQIGRPTVYLKDVAVLTCTKYQTTRARRHANRIPVEAAHKIATHFGVTPTDIWPDWPKGYDQ